MTSRLPPEFNSKWYVDTFPDVAMSGVPPEDHFLWFGRLMGRQPGPNVRASSIPAVVETDAVQDQRLHGEDPGSPIIDRPQDFDPMDRAFESESFVEGSSGDSISLETLASALSGQASGRQALFGYARLLSLKPPCDDDYVSSGLSCDSKAVESGPARIARAWYADRSTLRLMIDCGEALNSGPSRWSVRGYQAAPSAPDDLRMLGNGIQLPAEGPAFLDLALTHPLMPILLQLSDADSVTRAFALLPFPSLLPGGLHYAELKANQSEVDPMADFWRTSDMLLREAVGGDGWPERSVRLIRIVTSNEEDDECENRSLSGDLNDWLDAVFGIAIVRETTFEGPGIGALELPDGFVPTIAALVSRQLGAESDRSLVGPYLVADSLTYQPRWSVAPSADSASVDGSSVPIFPRTGSDYMAAPIHLAIALRPTVVVSDALPELTTAQSRTDQDSVPVSIVLFAKDQEFTGALLTALSPILSNVDSELCVLFESENEGPRTVLDRHLGTDGWRRLPNGYGIVEAAREARNKHVLSISDRIQIKGTKQIWELIKMLERETDAGSASCALLAEEQIQTNAILQPASAGLFPSRVSFLSSPRLSFAEPNVLQALPDAEYPVVANTLHFTAWRRSALAALPPAAGPVHLSAADIRIGLDLLAAGFRNWCTTRTAVRLRGSYVPRDVIDPLGSTYLRPRDWEEIFHRVTTVRELF